MWDEKALFVARQMGTAQDGTAGILCWLRACLGQIKFVREQAQTFREFLQLFLFVGRKTFHFLQNVEEQGKQVA